MEKRYPGTILATACIPWGEDGSFQETLFRREVRGLIRRGVEHIYLFGTAGEGYAVTEVQFDEITAVFADEMRGLRPMVGLISLSMPALLDRVRRAYALGIRDFQFALPCWGTLTDGELSAFFHGVCDVFPDCRFLHYNLLRAGRLLRAGDYVRLAAEIPNLAGVKFTTKDAGVIHGLMESDCPLQFFLGEIGYAYGSMLGECGYLIALGTSRIRRAWEYHAAGKRRDAAALFSMNSEFAGMLGGILAAVGTDKIDGAYDKMYCKLLDREFPLRLLPPYAYPDDGAFLRYQSFLQQNYPQWLEG